MQGSSYRRLKSIEISVVRGHGRALESAGGDAMLPAIQGRVWLGVKATRCRRRGESAEWVSERAGRTLHWRSAPVAQLDRAPGFEPGGREFESLRARICLWVRAPPAAMSRATPAIRTPDGQQGEFDHSALWPRGTPARSDGGPERQRGMSGRRGREQSVRARIQN